ncbi:C40 family peptidase [Nocardia sp. NPDC049149]|uniref:C40 family peptidase n=1 Tax=Nocardia sp. NPDC049149 TaxID=3364315 RepID=UPI00371A2F10
MAMAALPMIGQALAGLAGGGAGNGNPAGAASQISNSGLTPEAQRAMQVLKLLAAAYGDGPTDDPRIAQLRKELGISEMGGGKTADAIKADELWKSNFVNAFNTLDNQLANYITRLAGNNQVDKQAMEKLIREVNVALAEVGTQAYTKAGHERVHQILTAALQKAHTIVSATNGNASETAAAINLLSNQYLHNIAGQQAQQATAGATPAAERAIAVARSKVGKADYVWAAEGPDQFDCSGLTQYSAGQAGVKIPRTASQQYNQLPKVAPQDIRPGDLIFPAKQFNNGDPQHVLMYIGGGRCIEAPQPGQKVQETGLPPSFYASRWT